MKAVILAAGKGTRMGELSRSTPKPLLKILNKTLIEHKIESLPAEITKVIIVVAITEKEFGLPQTIVSAKNDFAIQPVISKDWIQITELGDLIRAEKLMRSRYLITGGDGFIGSKIVEKTRGVSFDIKTGNSILDKKRVGEAVDGVKGIFHCAANISVPESVECPEKYYETNFKGLEIVIEAAKTTNARIVFSSSAAVYGEYPVPVAESAELHPKSPYAENKRDGEELLRKSGIPSVALRYFNVYGPGQSPQYAGVITFFISAALKNEDLIIYGTGKQVRDFIYIDDVVDANIKAMEFANKLFEIFNIGSSVEISVGDLAKMIIQLTNSQSKIIYKPARAGDIVYSQSDSSKACDILGWKPKITLKEGLKRTIESMKK